MDGNRYIDFSSQLMNVNIGHGDQRITEAVANQMQKVSFVYPGMITDVRGELGALIAEITPGNLTKTFFTLGGAEAIENSIKIARMYTGRSKIITHYRSYHGATYGAISAGGRSPKISSGFRKPLPISCMLKTPISIAVRGEQKALKHVAKWRWLIWSALLNLKTQAV